MNTMDGVLIAIIVASGDTVVSATNLKSLQAVEEDERTQNTGVRSKLIGSAAENIGGHAKKPVLIVR